jgi:hypothetical protein
MDQRMNIDKSVNFNVGSSIANIANKVENLYAVSKTVPIADGPRSAVVSEDAERKISREDRPLTKKEKLDLLQNMLDSYNNLPAHALAMPVNHYDFCSLLLLLSSLFKSD